MMYMYIYTGKSGLYMKSIANLCKYPEDLIIVL